METNVLLKVRNLKKYFPVKGGFFSKSIRYARAVDGISFDIREGETLGLVGESGCGKTTAGRTILRLLEPTDGKVEIDGKDIYKMKKEEIRKIRRKIQIIFQDPFGSLNPRMTVRNIVGESMFVHGIAKNKTTREEKVVKLLKNVGLNSRDLEKYPHEFSGGQRQRIGIARALALNPKLIICDEAVSALDVSIQAQVINLLEELQNKFKLTYLFIAHDLSVVKHISDRVAVMYFGKIVELASSEVLHSNPKHPYTEALLSAIPIPDPTLKRDRIILKGEIPSLLDPPKGCCFNPRCRYAKEICKNEVPEFKDIGKGHYVACHLY